MFSRNDNAIIKSLQVNALEEALIFSDHKTVMIELVIDINDTFILPKQSRSSAHLFFPLYAEVVENDKEITVDFHEQTKIQ